MTTSEYPRGSSSLAGTPPKRFDCAHDQNRQHTDSATCSSTCSFAPVPLLRPLEPTSLFTLSPQRTGPDEHVHRLIEVSVRQRPLNPWYSVWTEGMACRVRHALDGTTAGRKTESFSDSCIPVTSKLSLGSGALRIRARITRPGSTSRTRDHASGRPHPVPLANNVDVPSCCPVAPFGAVGADPLPVQTSSRRARPALDQRPPCWNGSRPFRKQGQRDALERRSASMCSALRTLVRSTARSVPLGQCPPSLNFATWL